MCYSRLAGIEQGDEPLGKSYTILLQAWCWYGSCIEDIISMIWLELVGRSCRGTVPLWSGLRRCSLWLASLAGPCYSMVVLAQLPGIMRRIKICVFLAPIHSGAVEKVREDRDFAGTPHDLWRYRAWNLKERRSSRCCRALADRCVSLVLDLVDELWLVCPCWRPPGLT